MLKLAYDYHSPVIVWPTWWEALVLFGAMVWLALLLRTGWLRLDRAPRRPAAFSPLVGGVLMVGMLVMGYIGSGVARQAFGITLTDAGGAGIEHLELSDIVKLLIGTYAGQGAVAAVYLWLVSTTRRPFADNRLNPFTAAAVGFGGLAMFWPVALGAGIVSGLVAATIRGHAVDPVAHEVLGLLIENERDVWFFALIGMVTLAAPVLEEVLYRGIIQETLGRLGLGAWSAVVVTSVLFALMHAGSAEPWALVPLFVLSLGFGWAYEKTGRLAAPIVMHVLFNASNVALALAVAG